MQIPQSPKGTRDFFPEDMAMREHIFSSWCRTCRRYGFERYDGPMFEHLELYTQKSGDEIEKQLYTFKDKAGRDIALRPEITPTLARMAASRGSSLKMPLRWYSIPSLFRYERMQKGRLREFAQLNMDILGIAGVEADTELIAAATAMMQDLGFDNNDFSVRVSSRTLLEEIFSSLGIDRGQHAGLYAILDRKHKIPPEEFARELHGALNDSILADKIAAVFDMKNLTEIERAFPGLKTTAVLSELFSLCRIYGIADYVEFDIGIVRGLAYYTGIVFELFDKLRSMRAIAGGGRYDRLVSLYGGPDMPAVGFAAGDVVLGELCAAKNIPVPRPSRSDVFVVMVSPGDKPAAITFAQRLRRELCSCEFALKDTSIGKQMKLADACRARLVVFAGGSEAQEGKVKIKDMTSGDEFLVDTANAVSAIQDKLQNKYLSGLTR